MSSHDDEEDGDDLSELIFASGDKDFDIGFGDFDDASFEWPVVAPITWRFNEIVVIIKWINQIAFWILMKQIGLVGTKREGRKKQLLLLSKQLNLIIWLLCIKDKQFNVNVEGQMLWSFQFLLSHNHRHGQSIW